MSNWFKTYFQGKHKDRVVALREELLAAQKEGLLGEDIRVMLEGVLSVSDLRVKDIMIPKPNMECIALGASAADILAIITESMHSRYPVTDEKGNVEGVLFVKDLLAYWVKYPERWPSTAESATDNAKDNTVDLAALIRPVRSIPESTQLTLLLNDFRKRRQHMAMVMDEHDDLVGLITIEDVLEQIVGEIRDEHDNDETVWILNHGTQYTVKGFTPLEVFNRYFETDLHSDTNETIAGLIMERLGHVPARGEEITIDRFQFRIIRADVRRIGMLSLTVLDSAHQHTTIRAQKVD